LHNPAEEGLVEMLCEGVSGLIALLQFQGRLYGFFHHDGLFCGHCLDQSLEVHLEQISCVLYELLAAHRGAGRVVLVQRELNVSDVQNGHH